MAAEPSPPKVAEPVKRGRKAWWLILIGLLTVGAIVGIVLAFTSSSPPEPPNNPDLDSTPPNKPVFAGWRI